MYIFNDTRKGTTNLETLRVGDSYEGRWKSVSESIFPTKLTILSINREKATVKYEWSSDHFAGYIIQKAILRDGRELVWGDVPHFTFILTKEGQLNVRLEVRGETLTIVMIKEENLLFSIMNKVQGIFNYEKK
jgi:hypothetical protein